MTRILLGATAVPAIALAAALLPRCAAALEIYKWIDENGVVHYSESRPDKPATPVERLYIASTNSPVYDPDDYHWSILNQAERIGEEWAAIQEEKAEEEALARAAAAEARIEQLEARLAAREAADYAPARPLYGPFALFPKRHHRVFNRGFDARSDRDPHRPPHHDRDRGNLPEPGPRPGWTPPKSPATTPAPGFSR